MDFVVWLALCGGLFAIMTFIHFFMDWIFQNHAEAMAKHNNWKVRVRHCVIYTIGFIPLLAFLLWCHALAPWQYFLSIGIFFFSHFVEDTYLPVLYWAKYIRRPPCMKFKVAFKDGKGQLINPDGMVLNPPANQQKQDIVAGIQDTKSVATVQKEIDKLRFMEFIGDTLGKILMIVVDQLTHIAFLFPIVWMVIWNMMKMFYQTGGLR